MGLYFLAAALHADHIVGCTIGRTITEAPSVSGFQSTRSTITRVWSDIRVSQNLRTVSAQ